VELFMTERRERKYQIGEEGEKAHKVHTKLNVFIRLLSNFYFCFSKKGLAFGTTVMHAPLQ
jgi:hypothetical protein